MLPELIAQDPILKYFEYSHLPKHQNISAFFHDLAQNMATCLPRNPERTVVFRKLLEAKDAAVRSALDI